jgi:hypothetical protein
MYSAVADSCRSSVVARDGGVRAAVGSVARRGSGWGCVRPARLGTARRDSCRWTDGRRSLLGWHALTLVKIGMLLALHGVVVSYRTLHRFCACNLRSRNRRHGGAN